MVRLSSFGAGPDPELYHVNGTYPQAYYQYSEQADTALNPTSGWCDYGAPSCAGRSHLDAIVNTNGLKMILASPFKVVVSCTSLGEDLRC